MYKHTVNVLVLLGIVPKKSALSAKLLQILRTDFEELKRGGGGEPNTFLGYFKSYK